MTLSRNPVRHKRLLGLLRSRTRPRWPIRHTIHQAVTWLQEKVQLCMLHHRRLYLSRTTLSQASTLRRTTHPQLSFKAFP